MPTHQNSPLWTGKRCSWGRREVSLSWDEHHLLGRRTYQEMAIWDTLPLHDQPQVMRDFAESWRAAGKIVYSTTLESVRTRRTRIHRSFEPDAVRTMKNAAEHDLVIGGADIAVDAFRNGVVDECHLFVVPVVVGGGKRASGRGAVEPRPA